MNNHKSENQEQQKSQTDQDQTGSATKEGQNKGAHTLGGRIMTAGVAPETIREEETQFSPEKGQGKSTHSKWAKAG